LAPLKRDHEARDDRHERCQWARCSRPSTIVFLGDGLCDEHFIKLCAQQEQTERKVQIVRGDP